MENSYRVTNLFENNPCLQFNYTYHHSFQDIAKAFIAKFNWESYKHFTTFGSVEQPNEDEVILYRR